MKKSGSWSRRSFMKSVGAFGAAAVAFDPKGLSRIDEASQSVAGKTAEDVAKDEFYWREIQLAFKLDRELINLNNGFTCPMPRVSLDSVFRYMEMINMLPVHYQGMVAGNSETLRRRMANEFGCDREEMALTRGASEALQIAQNGIDLKPGDEVITTEQDYPRMLTTWDQRMRREGIKVTRLQFPVPATQDFLYNMFEKAITPRTKVFHFTHITNLTAQLFPVKRLSRLARSKGIVTIVDGAHALGQFPFKLRDLECDAYGVSLHKWLLAPLGNGCLYVRKEMIPRFWPLQAAPEQQDNDIRKFESIGTHPWAIRAALGESLAFHQAIGAERKAARLRYLNMRWVNALKVHPRDQGPDGNERAAPGLGRHGRQYRGHRRPGAGHLPEEQLPDHLRPARRRGAAELGLRLPGPPHLAERLHDARGDRHVHRGHGGGRQERRSRLARSGPGLSGRCDGL